MTFLRILRKITLTSVGLQLLPFLNPFPTIHSNLDKRKPHAFTNHYQTCIFNAPMNICHYTKQKRGILSSISSRDWTSPAYTIAISRKIETRREKSNMCLEYVQYICTESELLYIKTGVKLAKLECLQHRPC